ncbi:MAG TPA: VOC family protein [Candidatus Saccharimonadales bacterium]|nr:VOC family protein [Candidatus Saccharimonadales bacterium]
MSNIKRIHSNLYFVKDLGATANFYKNLDFEVAATDDAVRVKLNDFTLAFMDEKQVEIADEAGVTPKGIGVFTYIETENVDEQFNLVINNGIKVSSEPKDWPWGKREFAVKDPDDYKLVFYSSIKG